MSTATKHNYIEKDPLKYEGKAVITGTRIPVASIVNHYRSGMFYPCTSVAKIVFIRV